MVQDHISKEPLQKLREYERKRRMDAFRIVFERYKESIGEWEITDYEDAGESWRSTSKLMCECGRTLRYRYTVLNRNAAEILHFGINHLKLHTALTDEPIRDIQKELAVVDKSIEEIEERLNEDWALNMEIPDEVIIPDEVKKLLDEGLPLSMMEEKELTKLVQEVKRKQWESGSEFINHSEAAKNGLGLYMIEGVNMRAAHKSNPFSLHKSEEVFIDGMIQSGVGSAMTITEQLHKSFGYKELYITGRPKLYPLVVFYLDRLVEEGTLALIFNHGIEDRVYRLIM